jgi:hypothetical protein
MYNRFIVDPSFILCCIERALPLPLQAARAQEYRNREEAKSTADAMDSSAPRLPGKGARAGLAS